MSCPICRGQSDESFRPFCSKRCADIDLGRWMTGRYAVPSRDPEDIEKAQAAISDAGDAAGKPD